MAPQHPHLHQLFSRITPLPAADWARFEAGLEIKRYAKGELFLKKGKISNRIGFVNKGVFRLYSCVEEKELNYNFFAEGQFVVDYESFLRDKPSSFSIQALEDCEIYSFSKAHLLKQYKASHAWERFGRIVSEEVFLKSRDRLKELLYMTAKQRYLQFLKEHKSLYNRLTLYHIASYLKLDVTSLSRIRREISET